MLHLMRRSLLLQLLSVYLLFVAVVLLGGVGVNALVEQRLRSDVQASDQALAQEVARETSLQLQGAEQALHALGTLALQADTPEDLALSFQAWKNARSDVDHVYWLDPFGAVLASWPQSEVAPGAEFSPPMVVQRALKTSSPVFEVGIVGMTAVEPVNPGVIIAEAMRWHGKVAGIIAADFSLAELSVPLSNVVQAQRLQGRHLMISVIDGSGVLVATSDPHRFLQTVLDQLPGADQALHGHIASRVGPGPDGQKWLFSAVPVQNSGWAVVVQRPVSEALAAVSQFHLWLLIVALLFAIGGLLFWLMLLLRVIRPLHTLAVQHQELPASEQSIPGATLALAAYDDEVGDLARSLIRLERDGLRKLGELHTLLETSNAVVRSLDPHAVVREIMREVQQLVDVQAVAVLLPDEQGVLRVLDSSGHSERYNHALTLSPERMNSAAVLALNTGKPVQKLLDGSQHSFAYDDGFQAVLALPIISHHVGSVVLLVHRCEPQLFNQHEIDLLLTFANYATLAWEHAVLYERSDERLREVARENERLYRRAMEEKQKLEAIMGSMRDGLVLTSTDGGVLYANQGACIMVGLPFEALEGRSIGVFYDALRAAGADSETCERAMMQAESSEFIIECRREGSPRAIHLRLFDVNDEAGQPIGRGLLLRDVTRERELDAFKTTLLAAVGHEVRTPLAAIKGYASTLLQQDVRWPPEDQRHFLQIISSEADRLTQLVNNLLDLSRQEAGLLQLNCAPVSVQDIIAGTIERLSSSDATIDMRISADLPLVNIDRGRIEVVIHNLVANALLYGASEVCITAESRDDMITIAVADNGPGIAPDELPHVFERFYRAPRGRQQHSSGTGLGLTICKAFVEAHGGQIQAQSSAQGTTISFSLPLASSVVIAGHER
ncbi:MAG TPA: ATP-binding protein [Ktedonobacteraceae bacterium]|nr:ATP-binding protein [Ktedonobacteraceae bacterium]